MEYWGDVRKTFNTEKSGDRELCKPDYPMFNSQNPYKKQAVVVHTCDPSIPTEGWQDGWRNRIAWKLLHWLGRVCKRSCLNKVEGETRPPKLSSDLQIWVVVCMYPHVQVWEYMCLNISVCIDRHTHIQSFHILNMCSFLCLILFSCFPFQDCACLITMYSRLLHEP